MKILFKTVILLGVVSALSVFFAVEYTELRLKAIKEKTGVPGYGTPVNFKPNK